MTCEEYLKELREARDELLDLFYALEREGADVQCELKIDNYQIFLVIFESSINLMTYSKSLQEALIWNYHRILFRKESPYFRPGFRYINLFHIATFEGLLKRVKKNFKASQKS